MMALYEKDQIIIRTDDIALNKVINDIDKELYKIAVILNSYHEQEDWIAPELLNSWVNYGGNYNPAGYFKDSLGIVHLRGLIKDGTIGAVAFVLPSGYRPAYDNFFPTASNNAYGDCSVGLNGNVAPITGNNTWFSLDGIAFRVA